MFLTKQAPGSLRPLSLALALSLLGPFAWGDDAHGDYAEQAAAAKQAFTPIDQSDLAAARQELAEAVIGVERLVGATTAGGAAWLDYLRWDGLQPQVLPDAEVDAAAAQATLFRLRSGADGVDRPPMQRLGNAIERYVSVARFTNFDADRQRRAFDGAVDRLGEWLPDTERLLSAEGSQKVEQVLALLTAVGQSPRNEPFALTLAGEVGQPNAYVDVSTELLRDAVARPVNECAPLRECILGTSIRGTGATSGHLVVTPLASSGSARFLFTLTGSTRSNTVGVNGPVTIRSVGTTPFTASKVVSLSEHAFSTSPATASAQTRSRTTGVSKTGGGLGSRLVENIARKRIAQKRGQADAIASRKAEGKIAARLDEQLNQQIAEARGRYDERVVAALKRRRATPRDGAVSTDAGGLRLEAVVAKDDQLAAWDTPAVAVDAPLSVRVHQTGAMNLLDNILGGVTFWRDAADEPAQADIVTPEWLDLDFPAFGGDEFKPWRLRLRETRPVSIEMGDGEVNVIVHLAEFAPGDRSHENWDIRSTYRPERVDGRWAMVRQGDFLVVAAEDPASNRERAQRYVLAGKLSDPESGVERVIDIDAIDLSDRDGPFDRLSLVDLRLGAGWAAAGWQAD